MQNLTLKEQIMSLVSNYDYFTDYIDNYKQKQVADARNEELEKEFSELLASVGCESGSCCYIKGMVISFEYSLEEAVDKFLNDAGLNVDASEPCEASSTDAINEDEVPASLKGRTNDELIDEILALRSELDDVKALASSREETNYNLINKILVLRAELDDVKNQLAAIKQNTSDVDTTNDTDSKDSKPNWVLIPNAKLAKIACGVYEYSFIKNFAHNCGDAPDPLLGQHIIHKKHLESVINTVYGYKLVSKKMDSVVDELIRRNVINKHTYANDKRSVIVVTPTTLEYGKKVLKK